VQSLGFVAVGEHVDTHPLFSCKHSLPQDEAYRGVAKLIGVSVWQADLNGIQTCQSCTGKARVQQGEGEKIVGYSYGELTLQSSLQGIVDAGSFCVGKPHEAKRGFHSSVNGYDIDQDGDSDLIHFTVDPPTSIINTAIHSEVVRQGASIPANEKEKAVRCSCS
jgi:hypothetical protein